MGAWDALHPIGHPGGGRGPVGGGFDPLAVAPNWAPAFGGVREGLAGGA